MKLVDRLLNYGINIDDVTGVLTRINQGNGKFLYVDAFIGQICTVVPNLICEEQGLEEYDPEYDLLFVWRAQELTLVQKVQLTTASKLVSTKYGVSIERGLTEIMISQSEEFLEMVENYIVAMHDTPDS